MHEAPAARQLLDEDTSARTDALDVTRSFLVQAPAGSGKTELLIQRYLALLARVDEPEHIVALTFTRKAAGEMRERVAKALLEAKEAREPTKEHERITYRLARAAIARDERRGWAITEHVSRLSMSTFDALATELARRAPLSASLGPHGEYVDDAMPLYRLAAEAVIARARGDDPDWRTLLVHLDNNASRTAMLIADLLQKRDQLLRTIMATPLGALRGAIERALRDEIVDVLHATLAAFPPGVDADLRKCAGAAHAFFSSRGDTGEGAMAAALAALGLPDASVDALPRWRAIARFLMREEGRRFIRKPSEKDGFPAIAGTSPGAAARRFNKDAMEALCESLDATEGLRAALRAARRLPDPVLGDDAWRIVEALVRIVLDAVAELTTVFAARRRFDFVQGNLAALEALGDDEAPSDLLLRLDTRVQHLLVDEFQDTSLVQLDLLRRLTAGWQRDDGRTLFAVGDPMQSIYRFREAEVRFFLEAQRVGAISQVGVRSLRLRRNFRSQANLVDWVNARFPVVLGERSDPIRGVVSFESAVASNPAIPGVRPTVDLCASLREEADAVVKRIHAAQAADAGSIAILVRARNHLAEIVPALRAEGLAFAAVELDRLSDRRGVIDLLALAYALTQPTDRAAWLAVLRAPWCGLTLADLFAVVAAVGESRDAPLLSVLQEPDAIDGLTADGRERLTRTLEVLLPAIRARGAAGLVDRVQGAWLALGGPACIDDQLDLEASNVFFDVLGEHEIGGDIADRSALEDALDQIRATPGVAAHGVQVMTMHKAKGLQFDTVILPGLATDAKPPDSPILRWRARDSGLLIAPGNARGGESEPLYAYLGGVEKEAEAAELGRLLYVACTRAKQRLHLVAVASTQVTDAGEVAWRPPMKTSALAKLWPVLADDIPPPPMPRVTTDADPVEAPPLIRVPLGYAPAFDDAGLRVALPLTERDLTPPFDWARETTRTIGTLAHRLLARIAGDGPVAWTASRLDGLVPRVRAELVGAGFSADELEAATTKVLDVVRRTLADSKGRWLFDATHVDARSEWALAGVDRGEIVRVVVDRTFVADGERWIVDFKTGAHEGGDGKAFLDSEVERYRDQMSRYGRLMRGLQTRPVRLALYYPLVENGFREIVDTVSPVTKPGKDAMGKQMSLW